MSPGPTFDRVYLALKSALTRGAFAPGAPLEPTALGSDLNASITPVRDALHRLVGERIVEAPRNDGFRVPAPSEAQLRALYGWTLDLLLLALRTRPPRGPALNGHRAAAPPGIEADGGTVPDLFVAIARRSHRDELAVAVENLCDRLGPLHRAEPEVLAGREAEHDALRAAFAAGDTARLRREIAAYHRRRQRRVPDLLLAWQRAAADGSRTTGI